MCARPVGANDTATTEREIHYRSIDRTPITGVLSLPSKPVAFALLMHGITVDKNEWGNLYGEMSSYFHGFGIGSLRFDFRGHGESGGTSMDVSIIDYILDIKAGVAQASKYWRKPLVFVATSFAAGPAIMTAAQLQAHVTRLALIAPVIDYEATFLRPITPWAKASFTKEALEDVSRKGYLLLDGSFKLSPRLIEEFRVIKPQAFMETLRAPVLTIHGERDSMVPFRVSRMYGAPNRASKFIALAGADHGFADSADETGESPKSQQNKRRIFSEIVDFILMK